MTGFDLFHHTYWNPFSYFGIEHPFLTIQLDLIFTTWLVLALLTIFSLIGNYALRHPESLLHTAYLLIAQEFVNFIEQSWQGKCPKRYFFMISSLFIFILTCNWLMLLGLEEPTSNYNTALALALVSFFYIQKESLAHHGFMAYAREYFKTPLRISTFSWIKLPLIIMQYLLNAVPP